MSEDNKYDERTTRGFYRPICTDKEIERIFDVKDGKDYLLKLKADLAVDNMRLFRHFLNVRRIQGKEYSFNGCFKSSHYSLFIRNLPDKMQRECSKIVFGDIFSNQPNGIVFKSKFGPIISLSYSLRYFLKFAHLALLEFDEEIPFSIRFNALKIAIRVMLQKESLDFLQDPRGIIPYPVAEKIHEPISMQMAYIAAHEFGHLFLGHLDDSDVVDKPAFFSSNSIDSSQLDLTAFNTTQKKEFDADVWSVKHFQFEKSKQAKFIQSVFVWFACLELFEAVNDQISPKFGWKPDTHPSARDRILNLVNHFDLADQIWRDVGEQFIDQITNLKQILQYDVSTNIEHYEFYGSWYLAEPDTEWRGRELIDRVDFY